MSDRHAHQIEQWRQKIRKNGITSVRAEVLNTNDIVRRAGEAAIAEYEENQASERHSEQLKQDRRMIELQSAGNKIQWGILAVLVMTVLVTIALASGGKAS